MRQHPYDIFGDMTNNIANEPPHEEIPDNKTPLLQCPRLIVFTHNVPRPSLVDTGSEITCMSEKYYEYLKLHADLNEFPVSNVVLFTAVGKKPTAIRRQVLLDVGVGNDLYPTTLLVVPRLSTNIIIGNDWFHRNDVIINYREKSITVNNTRITDSFVLFDRQPAEKVATAVVDDITYI